MRIRPQTKDTRNYGKGYAVGGPITRSFDEGAELPDVMFEESRKHLKEELPENRDKSRVQEPDKEDPQDAADEYDSDRDT